MYNIFIDQVGNTYPQGILLWLWCAKEMARMEEISQSSCSFPVRKGFEENPKSFHRKHEAPSVPH